MTSPKVSLTDDEWRAKLTADRARYIAHPDWVAADGACPPTELWRPEIDTETALAETAHWYREQQWMP